MKIMNFPLPNIFHHQISSGHVLYSIMYQPPGLDPHKKYPVVLNIYGGPDFQLVTNTFKVSCNAKFFYAFDRSRNYGIPTSPFQLVSILCRKKQAR